MAARISAVTPVGPTRDSAVRGLRLFMAHFSPLPFVLLAAGCGHWEQRPLDDLTLVNPSDPVWIWSSSMMEKWHAVVLSPDSVSGIPYVMSLRCDSCRRSIPRAQVDSMKVGYKTGGAKGADRGVGKTSLSLAGAVGAILLLELVVCEVIGFPKGC
jgi:hypothetical protein